MGLRSIEIQLPEDYKMDFDIIQSRFLEKTGLQLSYTLNIPNEKEIKRYYQFKKEVEEVNPKAQLDKEYHTESGIFEVKGFDCIDYRLFKTKLELQCNLDLRYFLFSLLSVLEEQGVEIEYKIPSKYKIKWSDRKWYHRLKP